MENGVIACAACRRIRNRDGTFSENRIENDYDCSTVTFVGSVNCPCQGKKEEPEEFYDH